MAHGATTCHAHLVDIALPAYSIGTPWGSNMVNPLAAAQEEPSGIHNISRYWRPATTDNRGYQHYTRCSPLLMLSAVSDKLSAASAAAACGSCRLTASRAHTATTTKACCDFIMRLFQKKFTGLSFQRWGSCALGLVQEAAVKAELSRWY